MKNIIAIVILTASILSFSNKSIASTANGNYTIGLGPVGSIHVVDANPELGAGVGGHLFFDYRWSPQFSTQFGVTVTTQDGKGISDGDDGILFLGIPTFDLKFYVLSEPSRWDPYALIGMGVYAISEGQRNNGTTAVGIGANLGIGLDYYITEKISTGVFAVYRSIGLIDSTSGSNNGTALFPFSMGGTVAYHF